MPNAAFADGELGVGHVDSDLTLVYEKHHLHLARVFGHFEAAGR